MTEKCKIIREIFTEHNKNDYKNLCVFTKGFKAHGEFAEEKKIMGLITLKNAKVYSNSANCECDAMPDYKEVEWLNIFAESILAFTIVE